MSNSIERVEQWGEVLARLSNVYEARQIEIAKEKAMELPTCFKKLERLAASITPEDIGRKLEYRLLSSRCDDVIVEFLLLCCEVHYCSPGSLEKGFLLKPREYARLYRKEDFIIIRDSSKIILPNLKALFRELEIFKLSPTLHLSKTMCVALNVRYDTRSSIL